MAAILFLIKKESWPILVFIAILLSQVLIISVWKDAKWGSIANIIILLVAIAGFAANQFEASFRNDVKANLRNSNTGRTELLTDADLQHLPMPVQKYIRYSCALNQQQFS